MKIEDVPIDKIHVGERFRKDEGDIEALAANIRDMGLLQPVGVDAYYHLIFGARRLEACADILGWKSIPCAVLELESVLAGEYAENEFRKQFTVSEREAIGRAIERELGNRKGQRTDIAAIAAKSPFVPGLTWDTTGASSQGGRTVDLAAKRAGFRSAETFERAKTVVERGSPELIAAMDAEDVSISAAAAIASQPKAEQAAIIALPVDERREIVNRIRKTKAELELTEARARDLFLFRGLADAVELIAKFSEDPRETWAGLSRVSAFSFADYLDRALECLTRIRRAHPNEPRKPQRVG